MGESQIVYDESGFPIGAVTARRTDEYSAHECQASCPCCGVICLSSDGNFECFECGTFQGGV